MSKDHDEVEWVPYQPVNPGATVIYDPPRTSPWFYCALAGMVVIFLGIVLWFSFSDDDSNFILPSGALITMIAASTFVARAAYNMRIKKAEYLEGCTQALREKYGLSDWSDLIIYSLIQGKSAKLPTPKENSTDMALYKAMPNGDQNSLILLSSPLTEVKL